MRAEEVTIFYAAQCAFYYVCLIIMAVLYIPQLWLETHDTCDPFGCCGADPVIGSVPATPRELSSSGTPTASTSSGSGRRGSVINQKGEKARNDSSSAVVWAVYWLRRCGVGQLIILLVWNVDFSSVFGIWSVGTCHLFGNFCICKKCCFVSPCVE